MKKWLLVLLMVTMSACHMMQENPTSNLPSTSQPNMENVIPYKINENPDFGTSYVYYNLFTNGTRFWYYSMTGTSDQKLPLHVQALNRTLFAICTAIQVAPIEIDQIPIRAGVAEVNLPDAFTLILPSFNAVRSVGDALVMTLTEFPEIQRVQFLIDGKNSNFLSRNSAQYEINLPVSRPVWPNEESSKQESKTIVYWCIPTTSYLVPITVRLPHSENVSEQALSILRQGPLFYASQFTPSVELILSPQDDLRQPIPIRSFSVFHRVAFVDLDCSAQDTVYCDEEFSTALRAVVQTLTESGEIDKVQFMFRGKRMAMVVDDINLGDPVTRFLFINKANLDVS